MGSFLSYPGFIKIRLIGRTAQSRLTDLLSQIRSHPERSDGSAQPFFAYS
jgi:hypothetical protein|tara:strand:- start:7598 stop:7747 length:150 start_codon:yes stop_codon:yes gene_type:complete